MPDDDRRHARAVGCVLMLAVLTTGCSALDGDTETISVFDLAPGDCVLAPETVEVELTEVSSVPCDQPHELEVYANVTFPDTGSGQGAGSTFPGDAALRDFADGACAEEFAGYVGIDYRDSSLWFTFLVPSARSWEAEEDRTVLCLITTTGEQLTQSVAGTRW